MKNAKDAAIITFTAINEIWGLILNLYPRQSPFSQTYFFKILLIVSSIKLFKISTFLVVEWINALTRNPSIVPGIPPNYDHWDNLRIWFIRFNYDASAKEWGKFFQQDGANDRRFFKLAEKSNEAMNKLSQPVKMDTKASEENWKAVVEMVNLFRAILI